MEQKPLIERITQGQWIPSFGESSGNFGIFTKRSVEGDYPDQPICFISPAEYVSDTDKANAKLIAQAPQLLFENEELKAILKQAVQKFNSEDEDWYRDNANGVYQSHKTYSPLPEWVEKANNILNR